MRTWFRLAAVAAALAVVGFGQAQDRDRTKDADRDKTGGANLTARQFVDQAATAGMAEVAMSKVGQERAQSAEVKRFAARMVADHSKANDDLKDVARGLKIELPAEAAHKDHMPDLPAGAAFDKAYMDHMVKDHEAAARLFDRASKELTEEPLKAFATKTLPTIQDHLKEARRIQGVVAQGTPARLTDDVARPDRSARPDTPFPGSVGMLVQADGRQLRVLEVLNGSPAERAGLRAGDELMQVGAFRATGQAGPDELRAAIQEVVTKQPGEKVAIAVRREGGDRSVDVTVGRRADWFPNTPPYPTAGTHVAGYTPAPGVIPAGGIDAGGPDGRPRLADAPRADLERRLEQLQAEMDAIRAELRRR